MDQFSEEETLILPQCKLTEFPPIPAGIKGVDLRRNQLTEVVISDGNTIEYIDISDNKIRRIEPLAALHSARVIDCSYNLIDCIPPLGTNSLREFYLISNDIARLENLSFPLLLKLDAANNDIRAIENLDAPLLEELYLPGNKITTAENIGHLTRLRILDLQYNRIERLDCRSIPQSVEILMLQGNACLRSIENVGWLANLKMVNLKNTPLHGTVLDGRIETW